MQAKTESSPVTVCQAETKITRASDSQINFKVARVSDSQYKNRKSLPARLKQKVANVTESQTGTEIVS